MAALTAAQKEARSKAASELIRLSYQKVTKKMPRNRLTKANADKVFDCDIDYLRDATGTVIFPDDWMWNCLPAPFTYFIVAKLEEEIIPDAAEDAMYDGETVVIVLNVPSQVHSDDLSCWLKKGLEEEDPALQKAIQGVEHCESALAKNQEKLDNVPFMEVKAETAKEAAEERKLVTKYLLHEKGNLDKALDRKKAVLGEAYRRKKRERVTTHMVSSSEKAKRSVFYAKFPGKVGATLAWQAVHKESWGHVRLGLGDGENIPPLASLTALPDDYVMHEVNMRLVRVERLKHGMGTYTYWNNEAYRGLWKENKRHGQGALYSLSGKFDGEFCDDHVRGQGHFQYASGDSYVGNWDCALQVQAPMLVPEKYQVGCFHGKGVLHFADGSTYQGDFVEGRITGEGRWCNPKSGELKVGTFKDGQLHGRGLFVTAKAERFEGEWREGEMIHKGSFKDKNGDTYVGDFRDGVYHGKGVLQYKNGDRYSGFFADGLRDGPGSFTYGDVTPEFDHRTGKTFMRYDSKYEGEFCVGKMRARCVHATMARGETTVHSDDIYYYTTNNKLVCYYRHFRWLQSFYSGARTMYCRSVGYDYLLSLPPSELKRAKRKRKMYRKLKQRSLEERRKMEYINTKEFKAGRERALAMYARIQEVIEREREEEEERAAEAERRRKQKLRREKLRRDLQNKREGVSAAESDATRDGVKGAALTSKPKKSKFNFSITQASSQLFDDPPRVLDPRRDSGRGSGSVSSLENYLRQRRSTGRPSTRL